MLMVDRENTVTYLSFILLPSVVRQTLTSVWPKLILTSNTNWEVLPSHYSSEWTPRILDLWVSILENSLARWRVYRYPLYYSCNFSKGLKIFSVKEKNEAEKEKYYLAFSWFSSLAFQKRSILCEHIISWNSQILNPQAAEYLFLSLYLKQKHKGAEITEAVQVEHTQQFLPENCFFFFPPDLDWLDISL